MDSVDFQAREKAFKGLMVCFILAILIVNLSLLFKIVRAAGGLSLILGSYRGPRLQMLVSLAIGDILVALFTLTVNARLLFEGKDVDGLNCRTSVLSSVYFSGIMPLVYGTGLMILVMESALFRQRKNLPLPHVTATDQASQAVKSLGASAIPWLFGIVVGLPLNIAEFDLEDCRFREEWSIHRLRAIRVVCLIIPSVLALFFAFVHVWSSRNQTGTSLSAQIQPIGNPTFSSASAPPAFQQYPLASFNNAPPSYDEAQQVYGIPHPGSAPSVPHEQFKEEHSSYTKAGYAVNPSPGYPSHQGYPPHPHYGNAPPQANFVAPPPAVTFTPSSLTFTPAGQVSQLPPAPTLDIYYHNDERNVLLVAGIVLCICTLPKALYELCYTLDENKTTDLTLLQQVVLGDLVFWLLVLRSFLLPLMWVLTGTLKRPRPAQQFN